MDGFEVGEGRAAVGDVDGLDVVGDADVGDAVDVGIDVGDEVGPGVLMGASVVTLLAIGLSAGGEHGLPFSEMRTAA